MSAHKLYRRTSPTHRGAGRKAISAHPVIEGSSFGEVWI